MTAAALAAVAAAAATGALTIVVAVRSIGTPLPQRTALLAAGWFLASYGIALLTIGPDTDTSRRPEARQTYLWISIVCLAAGLLLLSLRRRLGSRATNAAEAEPHD